MEPSCTAHMGLTWVPIWVPYRLLAGIFKLTYFLVYNASLASTVADKKRIHVVRLNPLLRQNYNVFHFYEEFPENQHKLSNYQV